LEYAQTAENLVSTRNTIIFNSKNKDNQGYLLKGLVSENSEFILYTDSTLSPLCCYYIALNYEHMDMPSDAYLAYKRGHDILKKLQDRPGWEDKFLRKLISLKLKLKVEY
jgi:hypothetical protein